MSIEEEVIAFVARNQRIQIEKISPDMSIWRLGIDGQDALDLLEAFCEKFRIDPATIDVSRYTIGPEGWGFGIQASKLVSLKWSKPNDPKDLMICDLIASAKIGKWFDPANSPLW